MKSRKMRLLLRPVIFPLALGVKKAMDLPSPRVVRVIVTVLSRDRVLLFCPC
jgi:hypothetical protein